MDDVDDVHVALLESLHEGGEGTEAEQRTDESNATQEGGDEYSASTTTTTASLCREEQEAR